MIIFHVSFLTSHFHWLERKAQRRERRGDAHHKETNPSLKPGLNSTHSGITPGVSCCGAEEYEPRNITLKVTKLIYDFFAA